MPAEAGIQSFGDNNNFKDLDSRFRGNDGIFPITTQSPRKGRVLEVFKVQKEKRMEGRLGFIFQISKWANVIAGVTLTLMMLVTVTDVILRPMGKAIVGIFELVAFAGAVVIGFSVPFTSWVRGHIYVDFFVQKFSLPVRQGIHTTTRCLGMGLFLMIGWNLILMGTDLFNSGEVSATLQMPFYPIVYGIGVSCFIQVLVLLGDIVKIFRGQYE